MYPDARIIQTHRDPTAIIPSVTALLLAMRHAASDAEYSGEKIARGNLKAFAASLTAAIALRTKPEINAHFHDVHFRAMVADPIGTVRTIYQRFGMQLTQEAEQAMREWLSSDDSHAAKAKFTLSQFGLDVEQIDAAFGNYINHYAVTRER